MRLLLSVVFALSSGCASPFAGTYGVMGQSREEFEHYVEKVFRFQNEMTSEVMMLLANSEAGNHEQLLRSEQAMHQTCLPLNEYVSREIDGLRIPFSLRRNVAKSTVDCEHAAHEVKALLDEF
ncbi:MAG: hypothetical protein ACU841_13535 [Gammaproteobacteria bacterium]